MKQIRFKLSTFVGLSLGLLVMLASPNSYGQAMPDGEIQREGITSYIFSPLGITALLVLALVLQVVYWYYKRNSKREVKVAAGPQAAQATKKRYDREKMSKALKASASSNSKPRALEEAIRLSQLTQPTLPERAEHVDLDSVDVGEDELASEAVSQSDKG